VVGDGMAARDVWVTEGDLRGVKDGVPAPRSQRAACAGVRALVVAMKRGNSRGAKGRRKRNA
jgi:hypothetical protein